MKHIGIRHKVVRVLHPQHQEGQVILGASVLRQKVVGTSSRQYHHQSSTSRPPAEGLSAHTRDRTSTLLTGFRALAKVPGFRMATAPPHPKGQ